jgi:signal peptidase II
LDQASKFLVVRAFASGDPQGGPLAPFINLVLRYNSGVSFSLLRQDSPLGAAALTAFSVTVVGFLTAWLWRAKSRWLAAGIGLIVGGALGNAMDRALPRRAVVDFLDLHFFERHLFVFNLADAAISAGVAMLIVDGMFGEGGRR